MTFLEIKMLIHYAVSGTDYRDGDFSAPAVRHTIDVFRGEFGLLESIEEEEHDGTTKLLPMYRITERGRVFVEALARVPLPEQAWVMPETELLK